MAFIDLHTHGLMGRDSRSLEPDDYLRLAEGYLSVGTGAFLPTLFPAPIDVMRAQMQAVKAAIERQGGGATGAEILGVHLEGPFVNPARCGALDKGSFLRPDVDDLMRLIEGYEDIVRIITVAPELPGALKVIEKASLLGVRVNMGHSAATSAEARAGRDAGAVGVTHLFNAMSGMHHREPGLAGHALLDDGLYVEVIADFAHISPDMLRLVMRCKPPEKILLVSDSLAAAKTKGTPEKGPLYLEDGCTLAGSGITLADAVANLVALGLTPETASTFAEANPRRYLEYGQR